MDFTVGTMGQIHLQGVTGVCNSSALHYLDLHTEAMQSQSKALSQPNRKGRQKGKEQPATTATRPVRNWLKGLKLARLLLTAPLAPSSPALCLAVLRTDVPSPAMSTNFLCSAPQKSSSLAPGSQLVLKATQ